MNHRTLTVSAAIAASAITSSVALADFVTFDIVWEGISGSNASATGSLTIDTSILDIAGGESIWRAFDHPNSPYVDFTVTIVGAQLHNGTYSMANDDFDQGFWEASGPLDLSADLIGQANFDGFNYWSIDYANIPSNAQQNILSTAPRSSTANDQLVMTSMMAQVSVVPLPPAAWTGLGLLGVMGVRRRMSR
ncbi:MAG: hypothetical protein CMJ35_04790 [Phycisphaerae bacterium]|nr:hypothetical protein [Phycisphaerae bacterium]HCT46124.1 hypothetical protein [Phycisphaerales bacterium]|tara:strand:+ start:225 stop:800 length:576 start_codon:yes stop_codon:yes gene_type:complete